MTASGQIAEHWLFVGSARDDIDALISSGYEARFAPGEQLFNEGDSADGLYIVTAGSVRVSTTGDRGETILAVCYPDDVLGELGVLDAQARSARASAVGFCAAYFVPSDPFLDLLERSPALCLRLLVLLTRRLRIANGRLGELAATTMLVRDDDAGQVQVVGPGPGDAEKR